MKEQYAISCCMKKWLVFLLFVFLCVSFARAQDGDLEKGYRGYVDCDLGYAYNLNAAQAISTNNMLLYSMVSTTHGYVIKNWFAGAGVGYYRSVRDKENMFPVYIVGCYTFENAIIKPFFEVRAGVVYDPYWIEKVQKYGALSVGANVCKGLQLELRGSIYSRPSRFFTANVAVVISYAFGK